MEIVALSDPRINVDQPVKEVVYHVGQNVRHYQVPFSAYSTSGTWSLTAPLPNNSLVDRCIMIQNKWRFTFSGTDQSSTLVVPGSGNDALRFMPFQNCVNNTSVNFNGLSFTETVNESLDMMFRSVSDGDKALMCSSFPSMQDYYQSYNLSSTLGSSLNPLASVGSREDGNTRGGFKYTIISSSNTSVVVDVEWFEPVLCAPLLPPQSSKMRKAFSNCKSVSFSFNLNGDLSRAWSHSSNGNNLSSISVSIQSPPSIWFTLIEPNQLSNPVSKGPTIYETYRQTQYLSQEFTLSASASQSQVAIPSINLQGIPEVLVFYARQRLADRTYLTSDVYGSITNLSVNWNNRSNLLKEASRSDLYQLSVKNGLKLGFPMFEKWTGSLVIVRPSDLGLPMNQSANVLSNTQISAYADVTNLNTGSSITFALNMWVIYSSKLVENNSQWTEKTSYLNESDVLAAKQQKLLVAPEPTGSGFFDDVFSGIKKGINYTLPVAKAISPLVKTVVPEAAPFLGAVGLGSLGGRKAKKGKAKKGRRMAGRGIVEEEQEQRSLENYLVARGKGVQEEEDEEDDEDQE
jgi:hypothetical protein